MKINKLKGLRVLLAVLFFVPITLYFIDFSNKLPDGLHRLLHSQLVPAILGGMWGIVIVLLLLTLLFGRIYCSVICPSGILQDLTGKLSSFGKKKKKHKYRFTHHKAANKTRYIILGVVAAVTLAGSSGLLLLLDPYSNFGRIASNLFRPLLIESNNLLATGLATVDNHLLYHITIQNITVLSVTFAAIAFIVFLMMSVLRGRLFCNTICPVGTLLSLVSRYSLFRITFDSEACNSCGNCERTCKAECIDSKDKTVDASRCVDCFNCISSCKKGGLQYRFSPLSNKKKQEIAVSTESECNSRRVFFATGTTLLATSPLIPAWANRERKRKRHQHGKNEPLTPPGAAGRDRFESKCTGCQLCVARCPNQILRPAGFEFGLNYMLKPHVVYDKAYCNYECTICSGVCPNGAIQPLTVNEKVTTQIGIAHFEKDICITYTDGTDCGACSEHCPTQAVRMVPYKGSLRVPEVNPEICIGCGGCEYICPVRPARAIHIVPNTVHQQVEKPVYEKVEEKVVDDFGF